MKGRMTTFRTADDERRFHQLYARVRAERWPSPPQEVDIEAPLGTAHVFSWPGPGVPVLLIPGWGAQATMWAPMLAHGFGGRPVHAVDLVGHVGLSVQREPITALTDYLPWLDAIADHLALDRVHVVGASFGGLLTLLWAAHSRGRVVTASLLDPGGLLDIDMRRFITWGAAIFAASVSPMTIRRRAARRLHTTMILEPDLMALARLVYRRVNFAVPDAARQLPDEALRAVTVPTLALLAEHSAISTPGGGPRPRTAARRDRRDRPGHRARAALRRRRACGDADPGVPRPPRQHPAG
jgi:pimeloyl-ACP methyl ester carboxylesterase